MLRRNKFLIGAVMVALLGVTTALWAVPNQMRPVIRMRHALVRITASVCSTGGTAGAPCAEPTVSNLPFTDTNYNVVCGCVGSITGAPGGITVAKTAASAGLASQAVVSVYSIIAATTSCAEVDCNFWED